MEVRYGLSVRTTPVFLLPQSPTAAPAPQQEDPLTGQPPAQAANCSCSDFLSTYPAGHHPEGGKMQGSGKRVRLR